jgi:hypothetical protein
VIRSPISRGAAAAASHDGGPRQDRTPDVVVDEREPADPANRGPPPGDEDALMRRLCFVHVELRQLALRAVSARALTGLAPFFGSFDWPHRTAGFGAVWPSIVKCPVAGQRANVRYCTGIRKCLKYSAFSALNSGSGAIAIRSMSAMLNS